MKHIPNIAGVLFGLLFVMAGGTFLLNLGPTPSYPAGSAAFHFTEAFMPTGYMTFVKVLEVVGGVLVMIPKLRNVGLLILGPILVNIIAYTAFVMKGEGLFHPMLIIICLLAAYLLWVGRRQFAGLLR